MNWLFMKIKGDKQVINSKRKSADEFPPQIAGVNNKKNLSQKLKSVQNVRRRQRNQ